MAGRKPFRADHVGSLLRPQWLRDTRRRFLAGEVSADDLRETEDRAIREAITRQLTVGLKSVTDGEYRRDNWAIDFFLALQGTRMEEMELAPAAHGGKKQESGKLQVARVVDKVSGKSHPMIAHARFLAENVEAIAGTNTGAIAKFTVPCPSMVVSASRDWRMVVEEQIYGGLDAFLEDLGAAYTDLVTEAYAAGCRYIQFDDVNLAYLCDANMRATIRARGDDPDALLSGWIAAINRAIRGRPDDMTVTTHICRGNFRSSWFAQGGYEPIAERIFDELDYDGFFLEYDSERAGGFEPLSFLPNGDKRAVLGLMTTKTGELEDRDIILRRIDQASEFADIDQLCLSPQCGFASHEDGNLLSEDQQWAKLRQVVELAAEVWVDD